MLEVAAWYSALAALTVIGMAAAFVVVMVVGAVLYVYERAE
jgi:hypothetical protein